MRALRFARHGAPGEVLALEEIPTPTAGRGEALVRAHASAINPSDAKNVGGAFPQTTLPRVPGRDFAGRVEAGPKEWVGKDVFGTSHGLGFVCDGAHAEYVVVPEGALAEKPAVLTMAQAASVGVPYLTALEGLTRARLTRGDSLLIVGGTGAVGRAVAQIGRWSGAFVIATTTARSLVDDALSRYVDAWIDLSREPVLEAARAATRGRLVDVAFNAVGGDTFAPTLACLARGGRMIIIVAAKDPVVPFDLRAFYRQDHELYGVDSAKLPDARIALHLEKLRRGFEQGALAVGPALEVSLESSIAAYEAVDKGEPGKRVIVL